MYENPQTRIKKEIEAYNAKLHARIDYESFIEIFKAWNYRSNEIFSKILPELAKAIKASSDDNQKKELIKEQQLYVAAFLGYLRIIHTALNKQRKHIIQYHQNLLPEFDEYFRKLNEQGIVPNETIHDDPIIWEAERAQDIARTYMLMGNTMEADKVLSEAILNLEKQIEHIESMRELGPLESALGVLYLRSAQNTGSQLDYAEAIKLTLSANELLPNPERVRDVGNAVLRGAFEPRLPVEFLDRISNARKAIEMKRLAHRQRRPE